MRPHLPDFAHEAKEKLKHLLREVGPLSASDALADVLATDHVPEALALSLLRTIIGDDRRFCQDAEGRWRFIESKGNLREQTFVVLDVETTGGQPPADRITELGAVRVQGGRVRDEFVTLINPEREIPLDVTRITGITNEMVADKPTALEVLPRFAKWLGDAVIVAHNAHFDRFFIDAHWREIFGEPTQNVWICSVRLARKLYPELKSRSLGPLCRALGIPVERLHRAGSDAHAAARVFLRELDDLAGRGIADLDALLKFARPVRVRRRRTART